MRLQLIRISTYTTFINTTSVYPRAMDGLAWLVTLKIKMLVLPVNIFIRAVLRIRLGGVWIGSSQWRMRSWRHRWRWIYPTMCLWTIAPPGGQPAHERRVVLELFSFTATHQMAAQMNVYVHVILQPGELNGLLSHCDVIEFYKLCIDYMTLWNYYVWH